MKRDDLSRYLNEYLQVDQFPDYGPNGLQAEGRIEIKKIVTAVSASIELFKTAKEKNADAILVHHGIIWDSNRPVYKGSYRERVKILLENNLNLYAYHLPLDAHSEIGNNIQIAKRLKLTGIVPFAEYKGNLIGYKGNLPGIKKSDFFRQAEKLFRRKPMIFDYGPEIINSVGIISGGAQREIEQAVADNLDVFITGEVSEPTFYYAREEKIHFISAGHHATETFGIQALGRHLSEKFDIEVEYVEINNPV